MNLLLAVVIALGLFCLYLMWREPSLIYFPDRTLVMTPAAEKMAFDELNLTTTDGVRIHGWYIPAISNTPLTILLLHGNAGNISHRLEKIAILRGVGANVCIIDYRGYGRSEGTPNEAGTYQDAQAAYDYLTRQRGIPATQIVVYGESLGSGVAVELATRVPTGGVIIEEAFTSIGDVGQRMFPFLPIRWLVRNKYDTLSKIGRINAPLLIFHSREDEVFPYRFAERLLAAAREPKWLVELRGGHNDAFVVSIETYRNALREFLRH